MGDHPLSGLRVLEVGGIGPSPFAGMLLADLGADVLRVDRPVASSVLPLPATADLLNRGKRSVVLDLKDDGDRETMLTLAARAEVLTEGFRPGVAERLGIGPDDCRPHNPALVYGRMTGWGQTGPLADRAGHDINYIGLTGALHAIGDAGGPPQIPINFLGDFGGGALYFAVGILAAVLEARLTGRGRVVDAAIVDGTTHLLASVHSLLNAGAWTDARGTNLLDGAAPFYRVYETSDGGHMAVGAIEPQFYTEFVRVLDVPVDAGDQNDPATWPETATLLAARFATRTRAEWTALFEGTDACVSPVLGLTEAASHPHMTARATIVADATTVQPGTAPRFGTESRTPPMTPPAPGERGEEAVAEWLGTDRTRLRTSP